MPKIIKRVVYLQYSRSNIVGFLSYFVDTFKVQVWITSSTFQNEILLSLRTMLPNMDSAPTKVEIVNADDETVFCLSIGRRLRNFQSCGVMTQMYIPNFCNLSTLQNQIPNLISPTNEEDTIVLPSKIKMVLTFGKESQGLLSSAVVDTTDSNGSLVQMLNSLLKDSLIRSNLMEWCKDNLRKVINVGNAAIILQLAQKYDLECLKEEAAKFVADNFAEVIETTGWKEMQDNLKNGLLSTVLLTINTCKRIKLELQD